MSSTAKLGELAFLFLKLGFTAFGGPAAHIGMMEREAVQKRRWLSDAEFLDLLGATNLTPGPTSTEMSMHLGYHRAGQAGLLVAGLCFIMPAVLLVFGLSWAYVEYGALPEVQQTLVGVKPVILAIVVQALIKMSRFALHTKTAWAIAAGVAALNLSGFGELPLLVAAGLVAMGLRLRRASLPAWLPFTALPAAAAASFPLTTTNLFLIFLKIGSIIYGSGYVLLAFLRSDLVEGLGWITEQQLLDAVAMGQITPGPVFSTATFIGYLLQGPWGAAAATLGIFLPAFFFVAVTAPWIHTLRKSARLSAFLDGVTAASLAIMLVVTLYLAKSAVTDGFTAVVGLASAVLLIKWDVDTTLLIVLGAAAGVLFA